MPYIGTSPSNGVRRVYTYTATASQTTFSGTSNEGSTLAYVDNNYLDVYQNGVLLGSADYTSTNGTSVVLAQAASVNDIIVIVAYDVFSVADTVSKTDGGTFDGNIAMGGTLSVTGNQTNTGAVTVNGAFTSQGIDDNASANAMTIDSNGVLQSVAGRSILPEFIDNCFLASNTASSVELQNCFSTTYSVYRLIGVVGGRFAGESNVRFTFLTGTNTAETEGMHGVLRHHDDASSSGYIPHANTSFATIVGDQSSTGFSVVDMHIYMQATAVQLIGMSGYHDQESDRGIGVFGYKSNQSTARTGFKITANVSGNLSAVNFSVYGIRIRQNATTKMDGSYS